MKLMWVEKGRVHTGPNIRIQVVFSWASMESSVLIMATMPNNTRDVLHSVPWSLNSLRLLGEHVYIWKRQRQAGLLRLRKKRVGWDITENKDHIQMWVLHLESSGKVSTQAATGCHQPGMVEEETPVLGVRFCVTSALLGLVWCQIWKAECHLSTLAQLVLK